ncbi:enoyl-CoA hydratase/isomerase family protein [Persicobacter diffluens]|uniref:Enoyl-CoA hydratase/isomerase family protein n=1 Tax=Persicobacter diffluens TaxID=981 RepID=A0AAN5APF9_9BACT|nr:hypothetical protein PEDI_43450 [Persicobacter diffluens]
METTFFQVKRVQEILWVKFQRDEKRNAFNREMCHSLKALLKSARVAGDRAVVLYANAGIDVWCSGHDLTEFGDLEQFVQENEMIQLFEAIQASPLPVINLINGDLWAGGLLLAIVSDINLALKGIEIRMPLNRMGLPIPDALYGQVIHALGTHHAKFLFLTGLPLPSDKVAQLPLFYEFFESEEALFDGVLPILDGIRSGVRSGIQNSKWQVNTMAKGQSVTPNLEAIHQQALQDQEVRNRVQKVKNLHGQK